MSHSGSDDPARPGAAVDLGVFGQVVAASELLLTQRALIRLDARVRAAVARQLVRPREPGDTRADGWSKETKRNFTTSSSLIYLTSDKNSRTQKLNKVFKSITSCSGPVT